MFWAGYEPKNGGQGVYNTADLNNVIYNTTTFDLSSAAAIKACEAFAGCLPIDRATSTTKAAVTLKRPVSLVRFKPTNPEALSKATSLNVSFDSFNGYSVGRTTCGTTSAAIKLTNTTFKPTAAGNWFEFYMLAPIDKNKIDKAINISLAGEGMDDYKYSFKENTLPLQPNVIYNITGSLPGASTSDIVIDVTISGDWEVTPDSGGDIPDQPEKPIEPVQPETVPLAVGVMVDNQGRGTKDASQAVGMVVKLGATVDGSGTDEEIDAVETDYDSKYAGKTIKAYALAFESINAVNGVNKTSSLGGHDFMELTGLNKANGSTMTKDILDELYGTPFANQYASWTAAHPLTGDNVTDWYIPAISQVGNWIDAIENGKIRAPEGSNALYEKEDICPVNGEVFYISSTAKNQDGASVVKVTNDGTSLTYRSTTTNPRWVDVASAICYPMFTIFE